jgi:hypothetical protein
VPARDPLSVRYDGVVYDLVVRAARASRNRQGVRAWVASPTRARADRGGRTPNERAFTRAAYYLTWREPINAGQVPDWSLKLSWGDDADRKPSARGRVARPVVVRLFPRGQARVRGESWARGGFRSMEGNRIDD